MRFESQPVNATKPLAGIKVIEVGQLLAGPFTGCLLAYFGAEVIKIEPPGGDPLRGWRVLKDGTSLWWRSLARNKKCLTLDLNSTTGQALGRSLIDSADVAVENFRPGTMEKWGLGPDAFTTSNPGLIYARISGYGQDGPYTQKTGFASVCEGISGFRYVNGHPGEAPVRPNLSIGDTVAGLHAAFGITLALLQRANTRGSNDNASDNKGKGQVVDVALYEAMFNLLEGVIPEYDGAGVIREPSGATVTGIVPTNTYLCRDGKYIVIGGNGDSIFKRLAKAAGKPEWADDPRFATNAGRVRNEEEIDALLAAWCAANKAETLLTTLDEHRVPAGPIYNAADMMADEHFQARGLFEEVTINGEPLKIPAIVPKLQTTPGSTQWPGPEPDSHSREILAEQLGLSDEEIEGLKRDKVI